MSHTGSRAATSEATAPGDHRSARAIRRARREVEDSAPEKTFERHPGAPTGLRGSRLSELFTPTRGFLETSRDALEPSHFFLHIQGECPIRVHVLPLQRRQRPEITVARVPFGELGAKWKTRPLKTLSSGIPSRQQAYAAAA